MVGECDEPLAAAPDADGAVRFTAASNDLDPNESLTFAIEFQPGTFAAGEQVVPPPTTEGGEGEYEETPEAGFWSIAGPMALGGGGLVVSWIAGGHPGHRPVAPHGAERHHHSPVHAAERPQRDGGRVHRGVRRAGPSRHRS